MWERHGVDGNKKKTLSKQKLITFFPLEGGRGETNIEAISFPHSERVGSGCLHPIRNKKVNKTKREANMEGVFTMKVTVRLKREKQTQIYECPCGNIRNYRYEIQRIYQYK